MNGTPVYTRRMSAGATAPSGYDAMGHTVPSYRLAAAYRAVKSMVPEISTEEAMSLVGRVADCVERDDPYGALREATQAPFSHGIHPPHEPQPGVRLDVIGGYRLLATLCAGGEETT
jgi:hypothetical protein